MTDSLIKNAVLILLFITIACIRPNNGERTKHACGHSAVNIPENRDDKERIYWQMPLTVLQSTGIKEGMVVCDVGAGNGYFTFYLSEIVGKNGKVIACDIDEPALESIQKNALQKE